MTRATTDTAKVIAAIAVVGIHATSASESRFAGAHDYLSLDFISVLVNQWARFSVPLFLYLSAYGLLQSTSLGYLAFLKKRLPTILIPYLFFSAIPLGIDFHNQTANSVITKLMTGTADYHLYFLVILAQCYLLFPLLRRFYEKAPRAYAWITWILFLMVILALYKTTSEQILGALGLTHPGWHASLCIYWLPYFMLGLMKPSRSISIVWVVAALAIVLTDYIYYSWQNTPVDYYNHFSRPSVAVYAVAVIFWLPSLSLEAVARFAPVTFTVYLIHPQILRIIPQSIPTLVTWLLTSIVAFFLAGAYHRLKKTTPAQKSA